MAQELLSKAATLEQAWSDRLQGGIAAATLTRMDGRANKTHQYGWVASLGPVCARQGLSCQAYLGLLLASRRPMPRQTAVQPAMPKGPAKPLLWRVQWLAGGVSMILATARRAARCRRCQPASRRVQTSMHYQRRLVQQCYCIQPTSRMTSRNLMLEHCLTLVWKMAKGL